jgi:PIN domain nuclease of toxin-antitoxin system
VQVGRLHLPQPVVSYLISKLADNRIEVLPIHVAHLLAYEQLPLHHRDPFDRVLIAQSVEEGWPIITADPMFKKYPIQVIW